MTLPDFLTQDEFGSIRFTGHRIGLAHMLHYYKDGYSAEMLCCEYPALSLALIHKVIAFYLEHQADVEDYLALTQKKIDLERSRQRSGPSVVELRMRLAYAN